MRLNGTNDTFGIETRDAFMNGPYGAEAIHDIAIPGFHPGLVESAFQADEAREYHLRKGQWHTANILRWCPACYFAANPVSVPVLDPNWSDSMPIRCSIET